MIFRKKYLSLLIMQKKEIIGKTEGIAKVNKMQGLLNNINNKNKIFSNENDIFNEYIPENNNLNQLYNYYNI